MSIVNDSGHAKNVANLSKLNFLIATLGEAYNPSNAKISPTAFIDLYVKAEEKQNNVDDKLNNWKNATNKREIAFEKLETLSTKLMASLQSSDVTQQTLDDFAFFVKQMRGHRKSLPGRQTGVKTVKADTSNSLTPDEQEENRVSTAKQSFDNKLQHFSKMILLLKSETLYKPNELAYNPHNLEELESSLIGINNDANFSYIDLKAARIDRNAFFYAENAGFIDLVKKAKAYIKSVYGTKSPQYKAAVGIKVRRGIPLKNAA
jgi:hypothetical protein